MRDQQSGKPVGRTNRIWVASAFIAFIVVIASAAWLIVGAGQPSITAQHDRP
jgi:hypothetical protein